MNSKTRPSSRKNIPDASLVDQTLALIAKMNTHEELREINDAVRMKWNRLSYSAAGTFRRGQKVEWDSFKRGLGVMQGVVLKVNQKTVSVDVDGTTWKVSASMLRAQKGAK